MRVTYRLLAATVVLVAYLAVSSSLVAQHIQSPESPSFFQDCVLGNWPEPSLECGESLEIARRIVRPAMGGGRECPLETKTLTGKCEPSCSYHKIDFSHVGSVNEFAIGVRSNKLSCLDKFITDAIRAAETSHMGVDVKDYTPGTDYYVHKTGSSHGMGFNFAFYLWAYLKGANGLVTGLESNLNNSATVKSDNSKAQTFINCTGGYEGAVWWDKPWVYARYQIGGAVDRDENNDSINLGNGCDSGEIYLDDACRFVKLKDGRESTQLCGNTKIDLTVSTPISLMWSPSATNEPSTIVKFKLDPHSDATQWMWRGSSSLPLLVYDHEHNGVITSAEQLFGSWTFGGKRPASSGDKPAANAPWRDGYEALGTLDNDLDGKVSGAELDHLGLWFDDNRDGVSQKGEVKTLAEVSVHTLYYQADKTEQGAIIATKGYERAIEGKNVVLPSMDWYEKDVKAGPGELLERGGTSAGVGPDKTRDVDASERRTGNSSRLFGVWGWTIDESSKPSQASGYLSFDPYAEGVFGTTISPIEVSGNPKVEGLLAFKHFTGTLGKTDGGHEQVNFSVQVANGALLQNTATLSADGNNLSGKTTVTNSANSTSGSYEYTWKAQRLTN
jgi:hypothetical protein